MEGANCMALTVSQNGRYSDTKLNASDGIVKLKSTPSLLCVIAMAASGAPSSSLLTARRQEPAAQDLFVSISLFEAKSERRAVQFFFLHY
jgi:hypothetical protein